MKVILQKLKKKEDNDYLLAERYYVLLSAINDLKLTKREIELIAFTAIKGNISYANIRQEFCEKYDTTNPSMYNSISKLRKMGVLVKDGGKVKVNPKILLNFENDVTLEVRLVHG